MSWFRKDDSADAPPLPPPIAVAAPIVAPAITISSVPNLEDTVAQMNVFTSMSNTLSNACWKKCITSYSQPMLSTGELACIDRCVIKYNELGSVMVDEFSIGLQKMNDDAQRKQQLQQALQGNK